MCVGGSLFTFPLFSLISWPLKQSHLGHHEVGGEAEIPKETTCFRQRSRKGSAGVLAKVGTT